MAYPPLVAAALSGATLRQLSYWRSSRTPEPLLAPEQHRPRSRVRYSFRDVVALRAFVYLRTRDVSLQRVRKAVGSLRAMGADDHLSAYTLVAVGRDVVWKISEQIVVELTGNRGQQVIAEMVEILAGFSTPRLRDVVPLYEPKPGLAVDPDVRGGYPVIVGTRIPYYLVAALLEDGVQPEEVSTFYPSVTREGARGALQFARYVDEYERPAA